MDDNPKIVDLSRREYRAEGIKGEPFFAAGWPIGVAALITIAIGTLIHDASGPVYIIGAIGGAIIGTVFQQLFTGPDAVKPPQDRPPHRDQAGP